MCSTWLPVAGHIFSHRLLLDIVSGEDLRSEGGALDEALLQLVREQLIREYSGASGPTADQPPDQDVRLRAPVDAGGGLRWSPAT